MDPMRCDTMRCDAMRLGEESKFENGFDGLRGR